MKGARALLPLFLVSLGSLGFEIALTRYFAVAKWSEYGYWVISIVLAGFALSGVVLALARDWFARRGPLLLAWLPAALIAAGAAGYHFVTTNPFNPLQLQNQATVAPQLWNIAGYYACLLPFFFLTGVFVSLSFVLNPGQIGRVYGFDLTGAGVGAAAARVGRALPVHAALVAEEFQEIRPEVELGKAGGDRGIGIGAGNRREAGEGSPQRRGGGQRCRRKQRTRDRHARKPRKALPRARLLSVAGAIDRHDEGSPTAACSINRKSIRLRQSVCRLRAKSYGLAGEVNIAGAVPHASARRCARPATMPLRHGLRSH